MGRGKDYQKPPAGVYRDEPDRDDAASTSSAVPLRDHVQLDDDLPPAYSDDATQSSDYARRDSLDHVPYEVYQRRWHNDARGSKTTVLSSLLTSDPKALRDYMLYQSRVEPDPTVRMTGTHTETRRDNKKDEKVNVVDFDLTVSLSGLLEPSKRKTTIVENGKKTYRGGRMRTVAPGFKADVEASHTAPQTEEWYHRFCASSASVKTYVCLQHLISPNDINHSCRFTITRRITDLHTGYLTRTLTDLLRSTNYRGTISITFPIRDRATTVMSDHFINRYRYNVYIWWTCVILQLWIITWPVLWLMTLRWEVLSARWACKVDGQDFPDREVDDPGWLVVQDNPSTVIEHRSRKSDVVHEQRTYRLARHQSTAVTAIHWVDAWKMAIVAAAEGRKKQTLTYADMSVAQAVAERISQQGRERTSDEYQGGLVGAVTGLNRGVSDILRDAEMARGWGGDT